MLSGQPNHMKMTSSSSDVLTRLLIPSLMLSVGQESPSITQERGVGQANSNMLSATGRGCFVSQNPRGIFLQRLRENLLYQLFPIWGKKSIFKIVINKWMIWNNYSEVMLVNICHNNI